MSASSIEWTEETWNPVRGCTKISPGCKHCYAETFAERWRGIKGHPYEQGFDLRLVPEKLNEPMSWRRPRTVFVNSMSDLFHDGVPFGFVHQVFQTMAVPECERHTFQILTKRPTRMRHFLDWLDRQPRSWPLDVMPLPNVWLGVSVEDRARRDRIDELRAMPAAIRFVSFEPLLEDVTPIDLTGIDWIIIGGESGHGARGFSIDWARKLVDSARRDGCAVFVKQLGASPGDGVGNPIRLTKRKGNDPAEWPEDLRIREMPRRAA
jgi:protein gp37